VRIKEGLQKRGLKTVRQPDLFLKKGSLGEEFASDVQGQWGFRNSGILQEKSIRLFLTKR